ncbi:hypothetical protein APS56_01965 [Pseudalgibacter alginicilyticus]|uniref:Uncharacterized protein n=1 Tax=Pseudalgibacter alginicilyticus TaxID=1736674 RepID=A0A0P0CDJ0_9FLAO|nr:hypothetical protein [Pseudalgibacter alginicilyticus]ALJ03993.1 hypothetical protein APS56_01965 [Pseudalgibacter alginicilyticus]
MKKTIKFLFALTAMFSLAVGCSDDDSITEPEVPSEVEMTSFGFYAEDNATTLFSDYVIEDVTTTDIAISLPDGADLTSLIARFTTTEGDVVKIGAVEQVSGTTANNFSAPIEYLVSEGITNKIYTVTVGKLASSVWSLLSTYSEDTITETALQINPTTSIPYVAYISDRDASDDQKMNLISYDGTSWTRTGTTDFSDYRASSVDLKFSETGTPFISFLEYTEIRQASIMSYENDTWSYVGGTPFTEVKAGANTVAITSDNSIYGFYTNDVSGDDNRRNVFARSFEANTWSDLTIAGRSGFARELKTKVIGDVIYLAILDYGEGQAISVFKYNNGTWTTLADKMKESEENTVYYYNIALDVDQQGNVYVAYAENNGPDTDYQLRVKKYDATASAWSTLGDLIVTTNTRDFDIAVDKYNNAMLFYQNDNGTPVFLPFDSDVNNWGTPVVFADADASDLKIEVAPNGLSYASYIANDILNLYKFDSPEN